MGISNLNFQLKLPPHFRRDTGSSAAYSSRHIKKDKACTYNVTMRRVRVTIFAVGKK
jgi:hypothetical protein